MSVVLIVGVIILLLILRLSMPEIKGNFGESIVARQLSKLDREEYRVINDALIVSGDRSSHIDHIVISQFGIFVIETKHYKGWIHGDEHSEYWTQSIYSDKFKFRNPIKQNLGHIRALRSILRDYPQATYHSIIAFTGSAELKNVYTSVPVVYGWELRRTILNRSRTPCLSDAEVAEIAEDLSAMSKPDKAAKKKHLRQGLDGALHLARGGA